MDWTQLIADAILKRTNPVKARTYRNVKWPSASQPVVLGCDDGRDYVVKGGQAGRMIVNEQIVGCLGRLLGAPVGEVSLVDVPKELIDAEPEIRHMQPGIAHGSKLIQNCSDRQWINHQDAAQNGDRFCKLALLYGWVGANDHQLIYELSAPHRVYSVDHGHFFPGGPNWSVATLQGVPTAQADANLANGCNLSKQALSNCAQDLENITVEQIAMAVAAPHESWGISMDERIAVADYMERRRIELVASVKS